MFVVVLCQNHATGFLETLSLGATLVSLLLGQALSLDGLSESGELAVRWAAATLDIAMLVFAGVLTYLLLALRRERDARGPARAPRHRQHAQQPCD